MTLYVEAVEDPIEGRVVTGSGQVLGFTGWVALVSALEQVLAGARRGNRLDHSGL